MTEQNYNETALLQRLAIDDEEAFTALFFQYQDQISQVAMLYAKDLAVAEEVLQEVFLKVWQKRATLAALDDFRSWLFIVTRNCVLDYLKRWANRKQVEASWQQATEDGAEAADYKLRYGTYQQLLQQAITTLPAQQQSVFVLARENQLTYEAIGQKLSISPLTVKKHMQRALQHIRSYLVTHGDISILLFFLLKK